MTREIKFRVFDKEEKKMEFVGAIDWTENQKIITCNTATTKHYSYQEDKYQDSFEIMQFTGLLDKNGMEIYDGDIVDTGHRIGEVLWDNNSARFGLSGKELEKGKTFWLTQFERLEVIGNIFQTPELLK